ncbi:putative casein kinase ii beta 2 subunit protein [Rosellinia necatrix]|uniref:Putative casein kinase ii beta 2 subunit protein n=1 Tax=Rosellinia necatrix TaxID=77044 RepID=A0A1W2TPR6_ROSNE|nr:putative casein kinase ii beta 2 subunit protein [Rosellinia necatrix]
MVTSMGGIWAPLALRLARSTAQQVTKIIRSKIASVTRPVNAAVEPVFVRAQPRHPVHPAAFLRQQKNRRWHSTTSTTYKNVNAAVRRFMSTGRFGELPRLDRSKFLNTQTGRAVAQITGRAPFASTLRPNLTGGALPRTAGGYGLGSGRVGGARFFSHAPASQAQVFQNVSAAVRAFWISGQKAQFDGLNHRGERRYRAVSALEDEASRRMASVPRGAAGSYIDFRLNPIITSLSPLSGAFPYPSAGMKKASAFDSTTLNTEGFLDVLSVDFARALKDLTCTLADIKRLSALGDLPIQLEKGYILRVRFPGVDADTVESLCDDLGLTTGVVREDPNFDAEMGVPVALRFPYAPDTQARNGGGGLQALTSPDGSLRSEDSYLTEHGLYEGFEDIDGNPWLSGSDPEGYATMSPPISSGEHCSEEFEGLEGVYRFIEECDRAQGRHGIAV